MKKAKKIIIIIVSLLLIVGVGCFIYFNYLYDSNKLNIKEKEWINNNANKVVSFGIPANINNFSKNGSGVFYDFTSDLESEYKLNINDNTYNTFDNSLGFYITNKESANDLLFYKDFYVLVSKDDKVITNINNIRSEKIGTLNDYSTVLTSNTDFVGTISLANNKDSLLSDFNASNYSYIFIPLNEYIDEIISSNYKVVYQFENIPIYYYLHLGTDKTFNSVITKFYKEWENKLEENYYSHLFNIYKNELSLTDLDIDSFTKNVYNFGFVNKTPFIAGNGNKVGGILAEYLKEFSKLTDSEFNYISYKKDIIKVMERDQQDGLGTVYYATSLLILVIVSFGIYRMPSLGLIPNLVMAYGDGLAALFGKAIKSKKYKLGDSKKSTAGSITMFVISTILIGGYLAFWHQVEFWATPHWPLVSALIGFAITAIEAISVKGTDNITVPLGTLCMLLLIG